MSKNNKQPVVDVAGKKHVIANLIDEEAMEAIDQGTRDIVEIFLCEEVIQIFINVQLIAAQNAMTTTDPDTFATDQDFANFARAQRLHVRFWLDFGEFTRDLAATRAAQNREQQEK